MREGACDGGRVARTVEGWRERPGLKRIRRRSRRARQVKISRQREPMQRSWRWQRRQQRWMVQVPMSAHALQRPRLMLELNRQEKDALSQNFIQLHRHNRRIRRPIRLPETHHLNPFLPRLSRNTRRPLLHMPPLRIIQHRPLVRGVKPKLGINAMNLLTDGRPQMLELVPLMHRPHSIIQILLVVDGGVEVVPQAQLVVAVDDVKVGREDADRSGSGSGGKVPRRGLA